MISRQSALQAAIPATETARLLDLVGASIEGIRIFAWLLAATGGLAILVALVGMVRSREGDLALLRVMGASRRQVFGTVMLEGVVTALSGEWRLPPAQGDDNHPQCSALPPTGPACRLGGKRYMSQRDAFRGGERMIARRWVLGLMAGSAAVLLSGCGLMNNRASYRFRMTVEVETPNGLRTGSSVYQFIAAKNTMKLLADERSGGVLTRGDATIIELDGGPVFVLLKTPVAGVDLGGEATSALLATLPDDGGDDYIAAINKLGGWLADPVSAELPREKWPLMVRFGDLNDPTSVKRVDPESLGVKRILLETTSDDVTTGTKRRLGWLGEKNRKRFGPNDKPEGIPLGNYSGLFSSDFK